MYFKGKMYKREGNQFRGGKPSSIPPIRADNMFPWQPPGTTKLYINLPLPSNNLIKERKTQNMTA
jgi:hypothetical protein